MMDIKAVKTIGANVDTIGIALFDDHSADAFAPLGGDAEMVKTIASRDGFKAKAGSSIVVPCVCGSHKRIVVVGLGKRDGAELDAWREAAFKIVRCASEHGDASAAIIAPDRKGAPLSGMTCVSRALAEGATLAGYRFDRYKSHDEDDRFKAASRVEIVGADEAAASEGAIIAGAQCWARDIANEPGNVIDPATFEQTARKLAGDLGLAIEVFEADELARRGMNALLAVGSGSKTPPRLIHITYTPKDAPKLTAALVGKGITFDSGGLSIKTGDFMKTMKGDKTGACTVLGAVKAVAELKLPVKLHIVMGMAENMPSGTSYRVDDIIKAYNGKTIEIGNTDAEGRVTLADTLSFASELKPDFIIDIATLTGACAIALGDSTAGLFSNDDTLADSFLAASAKSGERFWRLPLTDKNLRKKIKTPFADVSNTGTGREGGAIKAAMFLEEFVADGTPWAHLDIAACDFANKAYSYYADGATAFGCRTMIGLLLDRVRG